MARRRRAHRDRGRRPTVLLDGVDALLAATGADLGGAATRLCGLAAITVPPDPFVVEPWDELAATAVAAHGDDVRARVVLARSAPPRGALLVAWLDLRTGRLGEVRPGWPRPPDGACCAATPCSRPR